MKKLIAVCVVAVVMAVAFSAPACAALLLFNEDVTPEVIFGAVGNANGFFTVDQNDYGVELGLRAETPYGGPLISGTDGTYSYSLEEAISGGNFDWTVNPNDDGTSGIKIDDLTYMLGIDFDPSQETDFLEFAPITQEQVARTESRGIVRTVPEPASLLIWSLLGTGAAGLGVWRRRRRGTIWSEQNRQAIHQIIERGNRR